MSRPLSRIARRTGIKNAIAVVRTSTRIAPAPAGCYGERVFFAGDRLLPKTPEAFASQVAQVTGAAAHFGGFPIPPRF
jgi:hypothetical protein